MNKLDEENKELNKKRRIPLERKFMCKKINDILYGYLQSVATFNPNTNTLYVKKDDVNFSELERRFDGKFKRRALSNHMENLKAYNFVEEDTMMDTYGDVIKIYTLPYDEEKIYKSISMDTLTKLINIGINSTIGIYIYLLDKSEREKRCLFTSEELIKNCLGIKTATHSRDFERVNDILKSLLDNGIIDFKEVYIKRNDVMICQKQLIKIH